MKEERQEIKRLLQDAEKHGRWYIQNFDEVKIVPTTFDRERAMLINNSIMCLFTGNIEINTMFAQNEYQKQTRDKYENEAIKDQQ